MDYNARDKAIWFKQNASKRQFETWFNDRERRSNDYLEVAVHYVLGVATNQPWEKWRALPAPSSKPEED